MILENIERLCRERKISIAALEREAGIGNGVIRRWGKLNPRVDLLKRVADRLEVSVDDLLKEAS